MIIVVEGISAAGKSQWASRYAPAIVDESSGHSPHTDDLPAISQYWSAGNSERWQRGLALERVHEVVCFDTDPMKIHYSWCLWQTGQGSRDSWMMAIEAARVRITQRELGFADQIYFLNPSEEVVRLQKINDITRKRSNFEMHVRLYKPLKRWYELLECLSPGRVIFNAHQKQGAIPMLSNRDRYDLRLFDKLVELASRTTG